MIGRVMVVAVSAASLSGCYVYTAAPTAPPTGSELLLELNDRGRVGMGDSIGSSAQVIEGKTISSPDSAYGLRVSKISYLNGQSNNWTGEQLIVPRIFVSNVREKKFSKSRTWLTGSAIAAAVVGFIASRDILGFGNSPKEPGGGKPGEQ